MKITQTTLLGSLAVALLMAVSYRVGRARADGAPTMNPLTFGGYLDDGGRPVEGTRSITVRLWDAASGGSAACTTVSPTTMVSAGRWRVTLDAACATSVQTNPNLWAEVIVDSTTFPRSKVGAVPYALEARRAAGASGALEMRLTAAESSARPRQVVVGTFSPEAASGREQITMPPCTTVVTSTPDVWATLPTISATVRFVAASSSIYKITFSLDRPYQSATRLSLSPPVTRYFIQGQSSYFLLTRGTEYAVSLQYEMPTFCNPSYDDGAFLAMPILVEQVN